MSDGKSYLYILVGPPASGKSTLAKSMSEYFDAEVVNPDSIRKELFGDERCQDDNTKVFEKAFDLVKTLYYEHQDVIFDATNVVKWRRMELVERFKMTFDVIVAVCYTGSLERCLYWNKQRERHVPDAVINRMWRQYLEGGYPSMDEGYDMVTTFDLIIEAMNQGDGFEGDGGNPDKIREAAKKANDSLDEDSNDPVMCYIVESVESVEDIESSNSRWEDRRILRAFGTSKDARKCVENLSSSVGFDMRWLDDMVCFGETFNGQHTKTSLRYTIREVEVD